ncbi:NAD(P)-dependent dehydrogenase (short-subunit alcohol dehydrogenase family)/pimeloyl-ACP methyl ester carboxylesterase [Streptosporangium becharense]|uniref:NAD(P)-dependent dehydrogenase (Short-subunit alcohol dehydrogenase family)/pimeloyl-ACP methyl ester carboxylesterase n=1 Tax=Streptosporangium becharense TaxID=1816182 RepID=A0A7W9IH60_9ACTN|nr:SDR family oxidoreductase [Streptosporangium becharense]MBB2908998.1 NAD(P)-dependent dehydrogenase (short-subunit alcohol dehydrogenase family)/pimeloyl-ACP methyl ester carboxylesterase [Streptosporangium becharense]MBB5819984.1 NAD(P)-dependent dehydrogenase (short-subunit alcohol dehydrogenase family)/pimeloyl-ACP methyl ester carboxylesterase [Streptosporangium becharense]
MRWVESGDVRLALYEQGDPAAPTILLVHGYPDTHRVWDEVAGLLDDRFHVVRYDVRGAGRSGAPRDGDYGYDRLAADMSAVLDAVGEPGVHLVGHDWGSIQSWNLIGRPGIKERIRSFTSLGGPHLDQAAHFLRHGSGREVAGQLMRSWYIAAFQLPVLPEAALRLILPRGLERLVRAADGVAPRDGHPADTVVQDALNGLGLYRSNMLTGRRPAGSSGAGSTAETPVQLIEATRDPFVSSALLASTHRWAPELWHRRIPAGHWVQRSHPRTVARMIAEFAGHIEGAPPSRELRRARTGGHGPYADRLVVVTGAGSGIGRATARAFAAHGAEVICADIDPDAARRTVDGIVAIRTAGGGSGVAHAHRVDVADTAAMEEFARLVKDRYGVPDIVVNNAGIAVAGPFLTHSVDDWRRTLDVNLWGVIHGCRLFAAQMVERGEGGHIVNIASLAAFAPSRLLPAYSTAKAAVKMLSDCLRAELAGEGIGVTAICPGFVSTAIAANATYAGAPEGLSREREKEVAEKALAWRGYPPERVAAHILRAVHRDLPTVAINAEGKAGYALSRISPALLRRLARLTGGREISGLADKR